MLVTLCNVISVLLFCFLLHRISQSIWQSTASSVCNRIATAKVEKYHTPSTTSDSPTECSRTNTQPLACQHQGYLYCLHITLNQLYIPNWQSGYVSGSLVLCLAVRLISPVPYGNVSS